MLLKIEPGSFRVTYLGAVDGATTPSFAEADPSDRRVAADVGDADHGEDGPVAAAQHREWQVHDEHTL
jgi:hypothetical protein